MEAMLLDVGEQGEEQYGGGERGLRSMESVTKSSMVMRVAWGSVEQLMRGSTELLMGSNMEPFMVGSAEVGMVGSTKLGEMGSVQQSQRLVAHAGGALCI